MGRGPACPPANHGRRPFFSCKSPFQIFIHLPGEIPHSAQGTQWVAGKQGAPLYNDTAPVIPPEREKSSHIQVNLSFNLLSSGNSISLPECGKVFFKQAPKIVQKKLDDPICSRTWVTLDSRACNGMAGSGSRQLRPAAPHPGAAARHSGQSSASSQPAKT